MYPLRVSRPLAVQFPATDIPSSSTPPMFQAQHSTFDTGAEDQLAWDEFGYDAILATMDGTAQQADELGASQLTQPPPVLTQPSHRSRPAERPWPAGRHRPAERHRILQARRSRPWRHRLLAS
jgi:hypothetical protein